MPVTYREGLNTQMIVMEQSRITYLQQTIFENE